MPYIRGLTVIKLGNMVITELTVTRYFASIVVPVQQALYGSVARILLTNVI